MSSQTRTRTTGSPAPSRPATSPNRPARRSSRRLFLRRALLVLILIVLAAGVWVVRFSSILAVTDVQVAGVAGAQRAQVLDRVHIAPQTPLAAVDLGGISYAVAQLPIVDRAEVRRSWPHTVTITVHPRVAVLTVANPQGQLQVVDRYGYAFANVSGPARSAPLLTLHGAQSAGRQQAIRTAYQVYASLTAEHRSGLSKLAVNGAQSVSFTLHGVRVTWGDASDAGLKNTVVTALLKDARSTAGHDKMNVSTPQAPTTG